MRGKGHTGGIVASFCVCVRVRASDATAVDSLPSHRCALTAQISAWTAAISYYAQKQNNKTTNTTTMTYTQFYCGGLKVYRDL